MQGSPLFFLSYNDMFPLFLLLVDSGKLGVHIEIATKKRCPAVFSMDNSHPTETHANQHPTPLLS